MKLGGSLRRRRGAKRRPSRAEKKPAGEPEPRPLKRLLTISFGILTVSFGLGYLVATRLLFPAPPPPGDVVEVPDVRGLTQAEAIDRLGGAELVLGEPSAFRHPTAPEGVILGQSPLAGQLTVPSDTVRVMLSLGPERRPVPDVLRLREDWARNVLEASGFTVLADTLESELPRGRVAEVVPEPGTEVALPMEVQILVSTGPGQVRMPVLLGLERAEAEALIDSLGLVVEEVSTRFRFGRDQGRVVEQEPPADSLLDPGSGVRIVVGRRARGRE